jgi:hypothetical protein
MNVVPQSLGQLGEADRIVCDVSSQQDVGVRNGFVAIGNCARN